MPDGRLQPMHIEAHNHAIATRMQHLCSGLIERDGAEGRAGAKHRRLYPLLRLEEGGMFKLARDAQGGREVELSDLEDVDPGHTYDVLNVVDGLHCLEQHDAHGRIRFVVRYRLHELHAAAAAAIHTHARERV